MHSSTVGGRLLVRLAQQGVRPDGVPVGEATDKATTLVRNTASPEDLGTSADTVWLLSSLKESLRLLSSSQLPYCCR